MENKSPVQSLLHVFSWGFGFLLVFFCKQNPVSVIIPEEKAVTAGGFCAGLSKPAFAMSKRPRRSRLQGCYSCLGLVCCVYTVTNATGTSPCILVVVPEKITAVKSQHASEKNTPTVSQEQTASPLHRCVYFACLLESALKTVLIRILWYTC